MHMLGYFGELVADRRAHPRDDLTAALLAAEIDGDRLDDVEVLGFLFLMIIAGNETTTKLLGNAVYWLWRNPDQRRLVRRRPGLIPRWVEETLRYDGSTQALARTVVGDVELHGAAHARRRSRRPAGRLGQPRRAGLSGARALRHPSRHERHAVVRAGHALLSRGGAGAARGAGRARGSAAAFPGFRGRCRRHRARPLGERARIRGVADPFHARRGRSAHERSAHRDRDGGVVGHRRGDRAGARRARLVGRARGAPDRAAARRSRAASRRRAVGRSRTRSTSATPTSIERSSRATEAALGAASTCS